MATKVEIIYEAEATSLKATVNEVNKANDAVAASAKESSKEVADAYKSAGKSIAAAFSGGEVKKALADQNKAFEQLNSKGKTLTGQLRDLKNQITQLEAAGKDGSVQFQQLTIAAARLEDQIGDTRERVRVLASDTFKFDAAVGATQALASGFEIAQGAAALFGSESEDLQKVIAKTTAVTAIANGVNELANQITGQGPLKLALYAAGQKAVAFATAISTGAISAFRVALAATGIGLFITGVALLVDKLRDAAANQASLNRSLELSKAAAEGSKKAIEDLRNVQLDALTRVRIANGDLTQAEADRQQAVGETNKKVTDNINTELAAQTKLIVEKEKLEKRLAVFKDAVEGDATRKIKKDLQDQIANQEAEIKKSQENITETRKRGAEAVATINQAFAREDQKEREDEAKKAAEDRAKAAQEAAKRELEIRNEARKKLADLELQALATQLDEREKILAESNTKIQELEQAFIDSKFKKGSDEEVKLQNAITVIKEDATKQIAAIDQKAAEDKAARDKEAAEKLAQETLRIRVQGLDDEISLLKAAEINEGTSLDRRIKLIEKDGEKRIAEAENNAAAIELINAETQAAIREEQKKTRDEAVDYAFQIASEIGNSLSAIVDLQNQFSQQRIESIQEQSDKELETINKSLESEVVKENKRAALQTRTQAKIVAEQQKQARREKALNIFKATIDTAASIVKTGAQLGYPAAIPFQILAGIVGAANIAAIAAQPLPKFKRGGLVGGQSHEAGGTVIEAERGEFVVNKTSAGRHRSELDALNRSSAAFRKLIDERYVRPAIFSYANKRKDGIVVNASLNSKSMEKELKGLRKDMRKQGATININGLDSRYSWQRN